MKSIVSIIIVTFGFSALADVVNCESNWKEMNQTQLTANLKEFVIDTKNQLISAFASNGTEIKEAQIEFSPVTTATQYTRYNTSSGYYFNTVQVPSAVIKVSGKVYSFKLTPRSQIGYINENLLMIGTYMRESKEFNSVGDIEKLTCSAATGFFGHDLYNIGNYLPISTFFIVRIETGVNIGNTSQLTAPTNGYTDVLIDELLP